MNITTVVTNWQEMLAKLCKVIYNDIAIKFIGGINHGKSSTGSRKQ